MGADSTRGDGRGRRARGLRIERDVIDGRVID
jgi:hypothetical protein